MWGRRRRDQRVFEQQLAGAVARVQSSYEAAVSETAELARELRIRGRRLPGMRSSCGQCGGPLELRREHWGRGKKQWSSRWTCTLCSKEYPAEAVHQSFAEDVVGSPD